MLEAKTTRKKAEPGERGFGRKMNRKKAELDEREFGRKKTRTKAKPGGTGVGRKTTWKETEPGGTRLGRQRIGRAQALQKPIQSKVYQTRPIQKEANPTQPEVGPVEAGEHEEKKANRNRNR